MLSLIYAASAAAVSAAIVIVDAAAVRVCGRELKSDVRGCWLRLSLCLLLFSLVFIGTVLHGLSNYTVDAIGVIAVMTGWLSRAFMAVFLTVHFAAEHNEDVFVCVCTFLHACVDAHGVFVSPHFYRRGAFANLPIWWGPRVFCNLHSSLNMQKQTPGMFVNQP